MIVIVIVSVLIVILYCRPQDREKTMLIFIELLDIVDIATFGNFGRGIIVCCGDGSGDARTDYAGQHNTRASRKYKH